MFSELVGTSLLHQAAYTAFNTYISDYGRPNIMDVGNLYSSAFIAAVLLELRRLMPFGIKWFSEENVDNITTVIGGMLYAESELYYESALSLFVLESSRSPLTAKFDTSRDWFSSLSMTNTNISEVLSKRLLSLYFAYDGADLYIYRQLIDNFFGIQSAISFRVIPDFLVYDLTSATMNFVPVPPGRGAQLSGTTNISLTKDEFYTIAYKFTDNDWVKRNVPGFPVYITSIDLSNEYTLVTESEYLKNPKPNYVVEEGTGGVVLLPLMSYIMQAGLNLDAASPHLIEWLNDTLIPAGLLVKYTSATEVLGDG